jgi:hypothetical protein
MKPDATVHLVGYSRHSRHPGVSGSSQERTFGRFVQLQRLTLDQRSVTAGYRAAMLKMTAELNAFKAESAATHAESRRKLDTALEQVRQTKLEFLHFRQSVTRDREQLAEINRLRTITMAHLAERDPLMPLQ